MSDTKCEAIDCRNIATHTWSGHPTCNGCGSINRRINAHLDVEIPAEEMSKAEWIKPVAPSLTYTQAMYEAGGDPKVGMECLFRHLCWGVAQYEQAKILAITKEYLVVQIKDQPCENHFHLTDITFKPLDGRSYSEKAFDAHYGTLKPPFTKKDALNIWNAAIEWSESNG